MQSHSDHDVARVAGMIGEPTRAAMLDALLGGEALPAGELARRAGVAPATATSHLARLVEHGLLTLRRSGRHRYFALASADVAAALEALARITPIRRDQSSSDGAPNGSMRFARTCYDHVAGGFGAAIATVMLERGWITRIQGTRAVRLTLSGREGLYRALGLDLGSARPLTASSDEPVLRRRADLLRVARQDLA